MIALAGLIERCVDCAGGSHQDVRQDDSFGDLDGNHRGYCGRRRSKKREVRIPAALLLLLLSLTVPPVAAHEFAPALLVFAERAAGVYDLTWKYPVRSADTLRPALPAHCQVGAGGAEQRADSMVLRGWQIRCAADEALAIQIERENKDDTAVLLRVERMSGTVLQQVLRDDDVYTIAATRHWSAVFGNYAGLGANHILSGIDHLAFVFLLLLLVNSGAPLLLAVTGFTLGHSVTLALAVLAGRTLPGGPVEACIALSVVFLARELLRPNHRALSRRAPALIAMLFGLLHGLGFAGALNETGLPVGQQWAALAGFNVGVELGQIAFLLAAITAMAVWRKLRGSFPATLAAWLTGSLATFWFLQRLATW